MKEDIKFIITKEGLCLEFENEENRRNFIDEMNNNGIHFFKLNDNNGCDVTAYSEKVPYGLFLSPEGRVALNFESSEQKFFFKERTGLDSKAFMDMGPRFEEQMHFNASFLPCTLGAILITTYESNGSAPKFG